MRYFEPPRYHPIPIPTTNVSFVGLGIKVGLGRCPILPLYKSTELPAHLEEVALGQDAEAGVNSGLADGSGHRFCIKHTRNSEILCKQCL